MPQPASLCIALIADSHSNSIARDAVLADAATQHPDQYLFLGDLSSVVGRTLRLRSGQATDDGRETSVIPAHAGIR